METTSQQRDRQGRRSFLSTAAVMAVGAFSPLTGRATSPHVSRSHPHVEAEPFGEVAELGWVVADLDRALRYWQRLGLGPVWLDNAGDRAAGAPSQRTARTYLGDVRVTLVQPLREEGLLPRFLKKHGEGVRHLGFAVESEAALEAHLDRLATRGIDVLEKTRRPTPQGTAVSALLDTEAVGGLYFKLFYDPANAVQRAAWQTMAGPDYPFGEIIQYATIVRDVDRVTEYYQRIGFPLRNIVRDDKGLIRTYRGEEEDWRMDVGWMRFGSVQTEIITPTRGRSIYNEQLQRHGEGFHHIAFKVDDMDEAYRLFARRGVGISQDGAWGEEKVEGRFAYLDTEPVGGLTIELLWW